MTNTSLAFLFVLGFTALAAVPACGKPGPAVADKLGDVGRVRIDRHPEGGEREQFFVSDPKDVAELLAALDVKQPLRSGPRFEAHEFPALGLTFFDTGGRVRAVLNFSGRVGPRNELLAIGDNADYLGAVNPAHPDQVDAIIARAAPAAN